MIVDEYYTIDEKYFFLALEMFNDKAYRLVSIGHYANFNSIDILSFERPDGEWHYIVFDSIDNDDILYEGADYNKVHELKK